MTKYIGSSWIVGCTEQPSVRNKIVVLLWMGLGLGLMTLPYMFFNRYQEKSIVVSIVLSIMYPIGFPLFLYKYGRNKKQWSRIKTTSVLFTIFVLFISPFIVIGATVEPSAEDTTTAGSQVGDGTETNTEAETSNSEEIDVGVRILYGGEWSGALSTTSYTTSNGRSISGYGSETIRLDEDTDIVSVNAQKMDRGSGTITVQIIEDGNVISESSSNSEYGVAQTSTEVSALF